MTTHEHIDHTKSLATLSNKYNIPVYANKKTWDAMENNISSKILDANKKTFDLLQDFKIGDINILPFPVPHDAACPCRI